MSRRVHMMKCSEGGEKKGGEKKGGGRKGGM